MYEELVKMLRTCSERDSCITRQGEDYIGWDEVCPYLGTGLCDNKAEKAADAIEELKRDLDFAVRAEAAAVKACTPHWIPEEERLPEDEKDVLVCYGFTHDGVMSERRFIGVLEYFAFDVVPHWQHKSTGLTVTHWMPLPEPPQHKCNRCHGKGYIEAAIGVTGDLDSFPCPDCNGTGIAPEEETR